MEQAINSFISCDKELIESLSKYSGKCIKVELLNTNTILFIQIGTTDISISNNPYVEGDITIRGTPLRLFNYIIGMSQEDKIKSGMFEISGDVLLAQNIQSAIKEINIDWEEKLSFLIGDTMTHNTGRVAAISAKYFKNTREMIKNNLSEYLHYETGLLISREELDEFGCSIDRLRDDTARLQEKINRINQAT